MESSKTVFLVEMNYPYEGSDIEGVFSSYDLAYQYVMTKYLEDIIIEESTKWFFDIGYDSVTITDYKIDKGK